MSRNFNNSAGDRVDLGDVAGLDFDRTAMWTCVCFCRFEDLTGDERGLITKWDLGDSASRQFMLQTKKTAAHVFVVFTGGSTALNGGATITTDTWYLVGCANDGSGTLTLFSFTMDGTVLDDAVSGTSEANTSINAADIELGGRMGGGDNHDGDIAHAAYFTRQWVLQDFKDYLRSPARKAARESANPGFYLPLIGASPEPDWSGNKNNGTVAGTTITNNPPVIPYSAGFWGHGPLIEVAAPGGFFTRRYYDDLLAGAV